MDNQISELKIQVASLKDSNKAKSCELSTLTSSLTLEEALERISSLRKSNEESTHKLRELESGTRRVDPVQKQLVDKSFDVCQKAWRQRKKMCMEIVGMLRESTGQSAAELFEEVGMENDA
jgi:regulator of replication initiation timing